MQQRAPAWRNWIGGTRAGFRMPGSGEEPLQRQRMSRGAAVPTGLQGPGCADPAPGVQGFNFGGAAAAALPRGAAHGTCVKATAASDSGRSGPGSRFPFRASVRHLLRFDLMPQIFPLVFFFFFPPAEVVALGLGPGKEAAGRNPARRSISARAANKNRGSCVPSPPKTQQHPPPGHAASPASASRCSTSC